MRIRGRGRFEVAALFALAAGMLIAACTAAGIAHLRPSAEVDRQFLEFEINPNYQYYCLNQENSPHGILGIDREYRFDGGHLWRPLDPDAAVFRKVVELVRSFPVGNTPYATGFEIVDPQGRTIGVWFSSLTSGVAVDATARRVSFSPAADWRKY